MDLKYLLGDAANPIHKPAIIAHCCNDIGGWGRGFVLALSKKYPTAEISYREWFKTGTPVLGDVQFVQVTSDICVANMVAQHDVKWNGNIPPIRYFALNKCFEQVYEKALDEKLTVSMPRLGAALAGGSWHEIEKIIKVQMTVDSYVYTLEQQKNEWPGTIYTV